MIQTILWDLDGTIIDTEPTAEAAVRSVFREWGLSIDPSIPQCVVGRTWSAALDLIYAKQPGGLPVARAEAEKVFVERYRKLLSQAVHEVPGSVDAIRRLAPHFRMAVVSGSHREEILWALKSLEVEKYFEFVLGAQDYPRSKPAPDGYLMAIDKMGISAQSALVFEDSKAGILSGKSAGVGAVVAIEAANHHGQDQSAADFRIADLRAVTPEWVRGLS